MKFALVAILVLFLLVSLGCYISDDDSKEETNGTTGPNEQMLVVLNPKTIGDGVHVQFTATVIGGTAPFVFHLTTGDGSTYEYIGDSLDITHKYSSCSPPNSELDGFPAKVDVIDSQRQSGSDEADARPC